MPRQCSICSNDRAKQIDQDLVKGLSPADVSSKYQVSQFALYRHRKNHLTRSLSGDPQVKELRITDSAVETLGNMLRKLKDIEKQAERAKNLNIAILAIREVARITELLEKICGRLKDSEINVYLNPQFVTVQTAIVEALEPFPEAKQAVVEALGNVTRYAS